mmetsp:Transcript_14116/g.29262  ORF Transcript_14116/g.29262 Transcript_14116/m.29262 type:complete len:252 (-) Transcript_14116:3-758(-)
MAPAPMRRTPPPAAQPAMSTMLGPEDSLSSSRAQGAGVSDRSLVTVTLSDTSRGVSATTSWFWRSIASLSTDCPPDANTTIISTVAVGDESRLRRRAGHSTPSWSTCILETSTLRKRLVVPFTSSISVRRARMALCRSAGARHASWALSASCTSQVATRSVGTSKALAIIARGSVFISTTLPASPAPCCSVLESRTRRRRAGSEGCAWTEPRPVGTEGAPKSSLRLMRAKRKIFCEMVKMGWPPVCVGVHS